jgi:dipeptide/tripeptide permease
MQSAQDINSSDGVVVAEKKFSILDLPLPVCFILVVELCERFSYYGLRALLSSYLVDRLGFDDEGAKAIFAYTVAIAYLMPIVGGFVADSFLGKFTTIAAFSFVYVIGSAGLATSALDPQTWAAFVALFLISIGTGGIKPCVSSFGADQMQTNDPHAMSTYFHIFYFSINVGSVASIILTPILRDKYSYAVAFFVPASLLLLAVVIFLAGRPRYVLLPPQGSVLSLIVRVMCAACRERKRVEAAGEDVSLIIATPPRNAVLSSNQGSVAGAAGAGALLDPAALPSDGEYLSDGLLAGGNAAPPKPHWLDFAKLQFPVRDVEDVKRVWYILPIFLALPIFWMLFDQQGSTWVLQAKKMDRQVGSFEIRSEQVQALNAVIVLICVPLFDGVIYPCFEKCGRKPSPLGRMMVGMFIAALAFVAAGFLDLKIAEDGDGKVNIAYQIPQYVIISIAEVLVSVTGLEFAYDVAPKSMKSTVTALFLLTTSMGNLLGGTLFSAISLSNANFSFMCSGLMVANLFIFFFIAAYYTRTTADLPPVGEDDEAEALEAKEAEAEAIGTENKN